MSKPELYRGPLYPEVLKTANISACGVYRYELTRTWGPDYPLTVIMLNPSTADASIDDPTIRRIIGFAKREQFGGIHVYNLFALRATDPKHILRRNDYIGEENVYYLFNAVKNAQIRDTPILCGWGDVACVRDKVRYAAETLRSSVEALGARQVCLGTTKSGAPRHPLYVKGDQPFVPFGEAP